jgi:hypothetical protein
VTFGVGFGVGSGNRRDGDGTYDNAINSSDAVEFGIEFGNGTVAKPGIAAMVTITPPESVVALPEPASLALLTLGGLAILRRR